MPLAEAVAQMHAPDSPQSWKEARRRIAYGELFALQLAMAASRAKNAKSGAARAERGPLFRAMMESLPFKLTDSQQKVIDEIIDGASAGAQSARLLQGDVGSGKTAVAAPSRRRYATAARSARCSRRRRRSPDSSARR